MSAVASSAPTGVLIGGSWERTPETVECTDPSRPGSVTGTFSRATAEHITRAYEAAGDGQRRWAALSALQRADVLRRASDLLEERTAEAAERLTADMGKASREAKGEILRSASILRFASGEALQPWGESFPSADPEMLLLTAEEPVGVVAAITPWNFPFAIPTWKLAPALVFGNAVVWKPAGLAVGSAAMLAGILVEAGLPDGALNLVPGPGAELSAALTADPRLAALSFTGSTEVGMSLKRALAERNVKLQLEMGGKNAAVVLADADLPDAADQIVRAAMLATGQRCTATSRVYAARPIHDELVGMIVERVQALRVGDPYDEATEVGPLASAEQLATVRGYLELARSSGCTVRCGGEAGDGENGYFVEPTVLTEVPPDSPLLREEIFGPVIACAPIEGLEEGLELANRSEFGLTSSVFTRDTAAALAFARGVEAGMVNVNRETGGQEPHVPFGGVKASSNLEREQGKAARRFFTTTKTIYVRPR
jgi:acyl-CoA reductase-like NAD-dependent aldehyde dehydrogenase